MPTYLVSLGHGEMLDIVEGADPADAVERYFVEQDAFCAPSEELSDEAQVSVLLLPEEAVGGAGELVLDADETTVDAIEDLVSDHGPVSWVTVDAVLAKGLWTVSKRP